MNLEPSNTQVSLAATTAYNANKDFIIKGFRSDVAGQVDYTDSAGTAHSIQIIPSEVPTIGGRISIVNTTEVALLIFL